MNTSPNSDFQPKPTYPQHPWIEDLVLPDGMFCPTSGKVMARSLRPDKAGAIFLPKVGSHKTGWFIVCYPGNLSDLDQNRCQEMIVEGGETPDGDRINTLIQPGDIISAMDFQCWPVDVLRETGLTERWSVVPADQVVTVIKQGTEIYNRIIEGYAPFITESDKDERA